MCAQIGPRLTVARARFASCSRFRSSVDVARESRCRLRDARFREARLWRTSSSRLCNELKQSISRRRNVCGGAAASSAASGEDQGTTTTEEVPTLAPSIKIPTCIEEVDNGALLGFGDDLAESHPGFHDQAYKTRRTMIGDIGRTHKPGQEIPRLEYLPEEKATWREVLDSLEALFPRYACQEYLDAYNLCNFSRDEVPQLEDMSQLLQAHTGWSIRPVAGLLHPRDFLAGLAFKTFHSTQYVRHHSQPMYTPEPDVVHELIGHVPLLLNKAYSQLAHEIGLASLGASEKDIWHLTKVYWYTIEFGVVMQGSEAKAFGAGILSSIGEMKHQGDGKGKYKKLDPYNKLPKMSYKDGYQQCYMTLDSFEDGVQLLHDFAATMKK